jgi:membrane protein involved in colicin uptake
VGTIGEVADDVDTQLILEGVVRHQGLRSTRSTTWSWSLRRTMKRRKKTPEERAAEKERSEDLDRRLLEAIERLKRSNEDKRDAES